MMSSIFSITKVSTGILASQKPISKVPEEILFIITHQAFELWFKVVFIDLDLICDYFSDELIVQHFEILETMSPMTFIEFRGELVGASGFQSLQFRKIENKLGLEDSVREKDGGKDYKESFQPHEQQILEKSESDDKTLFNTIERWLANYVEKPEEFWSLYREKWIECANGDESKKVKELLR
ncbi:hypothetical protein FSP39_010395 [Pinctada imbricata]|uniref:Tryptophan 2,3-dioxygenase n=1 Tax=Pinctada imbricata TaxID=66713 RepID=A0AA89BRP7_PINIB|nr:hypothetical protein FSP39_010395 [Pinctada imbricata]